MEEINQFVGERIHFFRKMHGYTLQTLADAIGKSKSTVSKYEKNEIAIDLQVLYEISKVLEVPVSQFIDLPECGTRHGSNQRSPFSSASTLYLYLYHSPSSRIIESVIRVQFTNAGNQASLYFDLPSNSSNYLDCRNFYRGQVEYHTSTINFVLQNQFNEAEKAFLSLYHPIDRGQATPGLLCGLTRESFQPVAMRCIVSLGRLKTNAVLVEQLQLSRHEQQEIKKSGFFIVENRLELNQT